MLAEKIDDEDLIAELPDYETGPLNAPAQRPRTRYDRLLRAVLLQALTDLRSSDADVRESAESFFVASGSGDGLHFTLEQIAHFGWSADALRRALPRLRKRLPPGRRRMRNDE